MPTDCGVGQMVDRNDCTKDECRGLLKITNVLRYQKILSSFQKKLSIMFSARDVTSKFNSSFLKIGNSKHIFLQNVNVACSLRHNLFTIFPRKLLSELR